MRALWIAGGAAAVVLALGIGTASGQEEEKPAKNAENKQPVGSERPQGVQRTRVDKAYNSGTQRPMKAAGFNVGVQRPHHWHNRQRVKKSDTQSRSKTHRPAHFTLRPDARSRMAERRSASAEVATSILERRTPNLTGDRQPGSFRLSPTNPTMPSQIARGQSDRARVRGAQIIGAVNRDRSVDYFNTRSGRWSFGLNRADGSQDLIEVRTGEWNMGFQNPDGTIDYINPRTGRWDLAVPSGRN
jgi:hypothetical protein